MRNMNDSSKSAFDKLLAVLESRISVVLTFISMIGLLATAIAYFDSLVTNEDLASELDEIRIEILKSSIEVMGMNYDECLDSMANIKMFEENTERKQQMLIYIQNRCDKIERMRDEAESRIPGGGSR